MATWCNAAHPDVVTLYADAVDEHHVPGNGGTQDRCARMAVHRRRDRAPRPDHPAVPGTHRAHFYVHRAFAAPAARPETAADALGHGGARATSWSHMGSHIYKNIGRFADGSRANEQAIGGCRSALTRC